ncbi:MAG: DUF1983 domain-containing protein [Porticoccaceae bacterium]
MSERDRNTGVPGLPLAALGAVQDENARLVLQAIADGWHVRNGTTGTGDNRFITAGEVVGGLKSVITGIGGSTGGSYQSGGGLFPGSGGGLADHINKVLDYLQSQVLESILFKELGERIKLIEVNTLGMATGIREEKVERVNADNAIAQSTTTQFAVINNNMAVIQNQQTTMANNVGALAQQLNTVQVTTANNTAAIQQETTVRINADNDIYAKHSVKIDVNGYVTGYGLISTANNSIPFSEFIVRADRFAIGTPAGPGVQAPVVPFIVTTTDTIMPDGTVIPPGVYMDYAMVRRLDGAYINAGLLQAAHIYTGSQLIDFQSKQPIPSVASTQWYQRTADAPGGLILWSADMRMYGPDYHSVVPYNNRLRIAPNGTQQVYITITVNATIDHFLSVYIRHKEIDNDGNPSAWVRLTTVEEPQDSYGFASITVGTQVTVWKDSYFDFGISCLGEAGWQTAKTGVFYMTMTASAVNW